ncbi:5-formyltetrahydrofolate cyclo-ligase [Suttonella sp. R2A3]|uniref:5-formyltetrahydrofolate cyclo-ligase n=1 Tax=Suttonella sp. R2A3 TaxID=2908648 RepID=UPI001F3EB2D4|nr:5-formyltetrahydrofolate cyclo-ligase [Suttonella sp. R2A3]UJF24082.1 5-formyltetrahydrofolate cyclo-ligase [Suttonella sp. R2A3]
MDDLNAKQRQACRAARRLITGEQRTQASKAIAKRALNWLDKHPATSIGLFLSLNEEIDTTPLLHELWARGRTVYLPVVRKQNAPLVWMPYQQGDALSKDSLGIAAPAYNPKYAQEGMHLDVVFTPLVAWDQSGQRIGMGGGFYDRTFAAKIAGQAPLLIGLAYACQEVTRIQARPWDIPMDGIITEQALNII